MPSDRRRRIWRIVMVAAILVGACGGPESSGSSPQPPISCVGVPQDQCDRAAESFAGSVAQPAVRITVSCTVPVCTATDGQVQVDLLLADGPPQSFAGSYGNAQVPVDLPLLAIPPICLGVPFAQCKDMAQSVVEAEVGGAPGGRPPIVRITIRCKGVCTPTLGEGESRIDFANGTNQTSNWGYQSGG